MREDYWTNTKTNTQLGVTGPLGSPRAWLRRAFNTVSLDDIAFQPGALTPYEISVSAVWYRPAQLPETEHRALYRFFDIPSAEDMQKTRKSSPQVPAIGIAAAVPMNEVLAWIAQAKAAGAAYTWWKTPSDKSPRAVVEIPRRRQLDHAEVYRLLDQGLSRKEIADRLGYPEPNVYYVSKKWAKGIPVDTRSVWASRPEMIEDFRSGIPVSLLAAKYKKSPSYIHKVVKAYR